ncbi:MAG: LacI family DNA-binding transcriptional regulator, partial [Proteobacteria bacterium]
MRDANLHRPVRAAIVPISVSTSSVSNYLNPKGRMAESTRQRIRAAMQEFHFTPNALVQAIKDRRTGALGVTLQSLKLSTVIYTD